MLLFSTEVNEDEKMINQLIIDTATMARYQIRLDFAMTDDALVTLGISHGDKTSVYYDEVAIQIWGGFKQQLKKCIGDSDEKAWVGCSVMCSTARDALADRANGGVQDYKVRRALAEKALRF